MTQSIESPPEVRRPRPTPEPGRASAAIEWVRAGVGRHQEVWWVLTAYLASRLAVLFTAKVATWYADPLSVTGGISSWDGSWYVRIAREGYASNLISEGGGNRWGFFPGLPALIRVVHWATPLSWETSGAAIAFVSGGIGVFAVYLAVREVFGRDIAMATAVCICFLPNAYTLSMVYTEGIFLACAGGCLYFLQRQRWELAGLAAAVAGFSRSTAVVLIACCGIEALRVAWAHRSLRPLTAPLIAPWGLIAFIVYGWQRIGEPLAFMKAQEAWQNEFDWFRPMYHGVVNVFSSTASWQDAQAVLAVLALLAAILGMIVLARSKGVPSVWWVYSVGIAIVAISPFWLSSVPRYFLPAFPLVAAIMSKVPSRARTPLIAMSGVMMGAMALGAFTSVVHFQTAPLAP